jgi:hypothetical protein
MSRGIKNNNPGNLVLTNITWIGKIPNSANTDKRFEQFETMVFGVRAFFIDFLNDVSKGKNTVRKLIVSYAPTHENDTENYIKLMSKMLGIGPDVVITNFSDSFLVSYARSVFKVENGVDSSKISTNTIKQAIAMLQNNSFSKNFLKKNQC